MLNGVLKIGGSCASGFCGVLLRVPFDDKEKERAFRAKYRKELRTGARRREHETLEAALGELRLLRKLVQTQRKRIWALENKEKCRLRQRQRRRAGFAQDTQASLASLSTSLKAEESPPKKKAKS